MTSRGPRSFPPDRHPPGNARRRSRGFTLIQLIFTIVLIGILAKAATHIWIDGFSLVRTVDADSSGIADARLVLERLAREVREVKYNTTSSAFCFTTMAATSMVFNKTSDPTATFVPTCGGATPTSTTNDFAVTVQTAGSANLNLGYAGSLASPAIAQNLTSYLSSFSVVYRDATYATTGVTAATVRYVEMALTLAPSGAPQTQSRTVVALRNH